MNGTYVDMPARPDRADRVQTFQRAMHYRAKTVYVSLVVDGQRLPQTKMTQADANRLITSYAETGRQDIAFIVD